MTSLFDGDQKRGCRLLEYNNNISLFKNCEYDESEHVNRCYEAEGIEM